MRDTEQFTAAGAITVDGDRAADLAADGASAMTSVARLVRGSTGPSASRSACRSRWSSSPNCSTRWCAAGTARWPDPSACAQLHPAARRAAAAADQGDAGLRRGDTPVRIVADCVRLRGAGAAACRGSTRRCSRGRRKAPGANGFRRSSSMSRASSLIAVGLAIIFSYIWGANVGGLFTALGITSIVLGLTLQNSVGQIISGLLCCSSSRSGSATGSRRPPRADGSSKSTGAQRTSTPAADCRSCRTRCWRPRRSPT